MRQLVRAVQRPEGVARHEQIAHAPDDRRRGGERGVSEPAGPVEGREEPQPVRRDEQPHLRPQESRQAEQHQHGPASPRSARLEHRGPYDEGDRRQVHIASYAEVVGRHAGGVDRRRHKAHRPGVELAPEPVQAHRERPHRQEHERQEEVLRAVAERGEDHADGGGKRMGRRGDRDLVVGRDPVHQVLAPHERVEAVVVEEGVPEEGEDRHRHEHSGDRARYRSWDAAAQGPAA